MNRLKDLRTEADMSQEQLARLLVKKHQAISKYERGQLDLDTATIARLCEIFGCTADYLLGLSARRTASISDAEAELLAAYHAAPEEIRAIVDGALDRYKAKKDAAAG